MGRWKRPSQYAFDASTDLNTQTSQEAFSVRGAAGSMSGRSVSTAGDVNNDGIDDLLIGAPGTDQAFVVFGSGQGFSVNLDPTSLDGTDGFQLTGPTGQNVGYSVSGGGDVNGDGIGDIVIGAPGPMGNWSMGAAYVVFGSDTGFAANLDLTTLDGTNGFVLRGKAAGDGLGFDVAIAGDANGDRVDDLIVGAPGVDPNPGRADAGAAYLLFGTDQGYDATLTVGALNGKSGFALLGAAAGDAAGSAVAAAGDRQTATKWATS